MKKDTLAEQIHCVTMNKKVFIAISVIITAVSCSKPIYNSVWQSKTVTADGNAKEWPVPLSFFDSNAKIEYTFSNDNQNVYACMKVANERVQRKIIAGGMEIWIDTTGKGKKQVGVSFPLPNPEVGGGEPSSETQDLRLDHAALKRKFFNEPKELLLTGFKSPQGGITSLEIKNGITLSINWDSTNTMIYEAIIPFKTFYKEMLSPADSAKIFGFTVIVNGLPAPKTPTQNGGSVGGTMPGGAGGMPGARGMGAAGMGGARGGGGHVSNPMYETNKIKTFLQLSTKEKKARTGLGVW